MESLSAIVCVNKEMFKLRMQHYNQLISVLLIKISKNSIASIPISKGRSAHCEFGVNSKSMRKAVFFAPICF